MRMAIDIETYLKSTIQQVNSMLETLVVDRPVPYRLLLESARYALVDAGKKLRPILALTVAEMCGASFEAAMIPACALEMVHAYSLIHDDLPCMDNDYFRRGKPTLHRVYPEGHAVLTGDYLLTYAFELVSTAPHLSAEQRIELVRLLAHRSGSDGMIGGQVMDIAAEDFAPSLELLHTIHAYKTGALITAAIEFGAIIANVGSDQRQVLHRFGQKIGLAFQIVDDVLDVTASEQKHGKASDKANHKTTFVTLLGVKASQEYAERLLQSALDLLKPLPYDVEKLAMLAMRLVKRVS